MMVGTENEKGIANGNAVGGVTQCLLCEAHEVIPAEAQYVSLRIKGAEIPIRSAEDVLIWVCKKMMLFRPYDLHAAILRKHPNWLSSHRRGMYRPYRIAHNCYVSQDSTGTTPLLRAAKILEWMAWPRADASLTYREPQQKVIENPSKVVDDLHKNVEITSKTSVNANGKKSVRERIKQLTDIDLPQPDPRFVELFKKMTPGEIDKLFKTPISELFSEFPKAGAFEIEPPPKDAPAPMAKSSAMCGCMKALRTRHGASAMALSEYRTNALVGTEPICLYVGGVEYPVKTWRDVYISTCDIVTKKDVALLRKAAESINNNYFGLQKTDKMRAPYCHKASGVWLNLYFSADGIIRYVKRIFDVCGFSLDEVVLVYSEEHGSGYVGRPLTEKRPDRSPSKGVAEAKNGSSEYDSPLAVLLEERFSNGVRPASIIDQNKIRRAYVERYGKTLPDDMPLEQILLRIGILNDGKVFPRPNSDSGGWGEILERLIEAGHRFFYYSCILESHAAELMSAGVASVDMLKHLLEQDATHSFVIGRNAFSCPDGPTKVIEAIAAVVGSTGVVLSEKDVCRKLPYVPPEEIHSVLAGDGTFFWNSPDTYVMSDRIAFDEQEVESSLLAVRKGIAEREYFSLSQLDFNESAALNDPRITVFAYRKVFSARFLVGAFDVRGQIVCRSGAEIDGCFPLRDYCRSHTEITLDQFFEVAKEFNIGTETALVTVYEEMVRVNKELFVSPALVTFDVAATDADLARRCEQRVSSLNSIGDLSDFSAVPGYAWNRFLLDSYLRRASKVFAIRSISMPTQEVAGVIVRKDCGLDDAAAAFAEIAIGHGVAADAHEVGEFLVATRCTLRRGPALIAQVVSKMRDLYERKR